MKPQLHALTSIRFFFASMVVVGHFAGHFPNHFSGAPDFIFRMAPLAVSWFFMLSGFIIAYNYPTLDGARQRKTFIISRIARLWPVHFVTLIAGYYIVGKAYPSWFLSHALLVQTWTADANIAQAYNAPSWSISNEMFFYLFYAAIFIVASSWKRWVLILLPTIVALFLLDGAGCFSGGAGTATCNSLLYQFPPTRLIEFLAGVALYHLRPRIHQLPALFVAAAVFLSAVPLPFEPTLWPNGDILYRQLVILAGGGGLISALSYDGWFTKILTNKPLIFGGEISYSMYMTHQLVMIATLPHLAAFAIAVQFAIVFAATLFASCLLYIAVERPARNAVKDYLNARSQRPGSDRQNLPDTRNAM
jgi:peptidoglycan/LPS O-acetylase OafA/YrhL